jgi:ABC-type uncharacterized transport system permease subunit
MFDAAQILMAASPLFIAACGALLSEYAGRLNIGLEGAILFGAFFAALMFRALPFWPAALLAAALSGLLFGGLTAVLSIRGGGNVFIVGLGINLLAWGLIPLISQLVFGRKGVITLDMSSTLSGNIGMIAVAAAVLLGAAVYLYSNFNSNGMRLSRLYLNEELAGEQGINVAGYQMIALSLSSALAGLAGGLIMLHLGSYVPNLSAGKGWIALVVIYLGNRKIVPMAAASLFFAFSQILSNEAQRYIATPGLLLGMPFLITLAALVLYRIIKGGINRLGQNLPGTGRQD